MTEQDLKGLHIGIDSLECLLKILKDLEKKQVTLKQSIRIIENLRQNLINIRCLSLS